MGGQSRSTQTETQAMALAQWARQCATHATSRVSRPAGERAHLSVEDCEQAVVLGELLLERRAEALCATHENI